MKKITKTIIVLTAFLTIGAATNTLNEFNLPAAKVTVRVIDESQNPVENANISLGFGNMSIKGVTDASGLFSGEGRCGVAGMGSMITKNGYYFGSAPIPRFTEQDESLNRWKPWNETYTVILRPVGKPIALYAKKVRTNIPVLNQPCGYDLEAGDWVMPYGKGVKRDFVFTILKKTVNDTQNFEVQGNLTLANPLDGLQQTSILDIGRNSVFKWDRQAPESGYQPKFPLYYIWWESLHQKPTQNFKYGGKEWEGYFFRVRTVDEDGKIVSAHYGKIRGGIEIEPRWTPTCTITFTYYFNPTPNDRNLEWNKKNNLFGELTEMEAPRDP